MHTSALEFARLFFRLYTAEGARLKIVDIGAQDVNGSLKSVMLPGNQYVGVDFVDGKGVDVILSDPYVLPFDDDSIDVCVSSSCFEHSEFFWVLFSEIQRVLKPSGLLYLNAPSNGYFHRWPVDCWRFYRDSGVALARWGRRAGYKTVLLESFVGKQWRERWNDFVAVFLKDERYVAAYPNRMVGSATAYTNSRVIGEQEVRRYTIYQEDQFMNFGSRVRRALLAVTRRARAR